MILNYTCRPSRIILLASLVMVIVLLLAASKGAWHRVQANTRMSVDEKADLLAINDAANGSYRMLLYDPRTGAQKSILDGIHVSQFSFSEKGRLAYSVFRGPASTLTTSPTSIYIWDTQQPNSAPFNISPNAATTDVPLAWSPDGRYLTFESFLDFGNRSLYVWDGTTIIDITPANLSKIDKTYDEVSWSLDERLAFTVDTDDGKYPHMRDVHEIYLWNGKTTTDLSQNPQGDDREPRWSANGRLAFLPYRKL
jgi:WD40 repeat protein